MIRLALVAALVLVYVVIFAYKIQANDELTPLGAIEENILGPGIHIDGTGQPFQWEGQVPGGTDYRAGGTVEPNAYGPGVGMDRTGQPVRALSPFPNSNQNLNRNLNQ